ncbi:MAG: hypothetical protein A2177_04075 [Spirochaetes bacterium RBG_13_68_11]|nr:MAG: hypothetical protein A2177_04075 [Spirochaetes bacterium RBG_13_68_11]
MRCRLCALSALALLVAGGAAASHADPRQGPGREVSATPAEVKDTFFAYVVGILRENADADVDREFLRGILGEFRASVSLPFEQLATMTYRSGGREAAHELRLGFQGPMRVPIPFSLLGYHPGDLVSSAEVRFTGLRYGEVRLPSGALLSPVYTFSVNEGWVIIDVDTWLDVLLGDLVDDIAVSELVVFRWRREWRCLMVGTGRKGQLISGVLNFRTNGIAFPLPRELAGIGEFFRGAAGAAPRGARPPSLPPGPARGRLARCTSPSTPAS